MFFRCSTRFAFATVASSALSATIRSLVVPTRYHASSSRSWFFRLEPCPPSTIAPLLNYSKGCRTKYRRFATAAEALRFAVEELRIPKAYGAWLEVGDERFDSTEIQRLYAAGNYPLRKPE
jgi:hypothetical protein